MERYMVRYKVKPERASENENFIKEVFKQLQNESPAGIRYAAFKQDDGVSFVHIASIETEDGENPVSTLSSFKAFLSEIKERCDEPPVLSELDEVGSYRFLDR